MMVVVARRNDETVATLRCKVPNIIRVFVFVFVWTKENDTIRSDLVLYRVDCLLCVADPVDSVDSDDACNEQSKQ
jgi:hypothetical protein